jgi:cold shock CspA family protein
MKKLFLVLAVSMFSTAVLAQECGVVKWYEADKGFGFIASKKPNAVDLFLSWQNAVPDPAHPLKAGAKVIYERVNGPNGIVAMRVQVVKDFPAWCQQ